MIMVRILLSGFSCPDSDNRIIIFATDMCQQLLSGAQTWFMDGAITIQTNLYYKSSFSLISSQLRVCIFTTEGPGHVQ